MAAGASKDEIVPVNLVEQQARRGNGSRHRATDPTETGAMNATAGTVSASLVERSGKRGLFPEALRRFPLETMRRE
jgi:hypothetical protein